jgi:hypothetical protein
LPEELAGETYRKSSPETNLPKEFTGEKLTERVHLRKNCRDFFAGAICRYDLPEKICLNKCFHSLHRRPCRRIVADKFMVAEVVAESSATRSSQVVVLRQGLRRTLKSWYLRQIVLRQFSQAIGSGEFFSGKKSQADVSGNFFSGTTLRRMSLAFVFLWQPLSGERLWQAIFSQVVASGKQSGKQSSGTVCQVEMVWIGGLFHDL